MPADRSLLLDGYRLVDVRCNEINILEANAAAVLVPTQGAGKVVVLLGYSLDDDSAGDVNFHFEDTAGESLSGPFLLKTGTVLAAWPNEPMLISGDNRGIQIDTDAELAGHFKYAIYEKIS